MGFDSVMDSEGDTMEETTNSTEGPNPSYAYRVTNRVLKHINRYYFRSRFINFDEPLEPTPTGAPRIYASNHSGMAFPWDGISFATGMLERSGYRVEESIRPLATPLLSKTPLMSPFLVPDFWERLGAIPATMKDFEASMQQEGTNLLIYPEGIDGIGKGFNKRYQLQNIATSLIRMSIKYKSDIVPVATVGAEYINPLSYSVKWLNRISQKAGIPFIPVGPSLGLVLFQPWMLYFALPAQLTFVRGTPFKAYEMVDGRDLEDVSEEEILSIRDALARLLQEVIDESVEMYGGKPFDLLGLLKTWKENSNKWHLFMPPFWPALFWENDRFNEEHAMPLMEDPTDLHEAQQLIDQVIPADGDNLPTLGSLAKTIKELPGLLSLNIPGFGLLSLARGEIPGLA